MKEWNPFKMNLRRKFFVLAVVTCLCLINISFAQSKDENEVRTLLATQTNSWNNGDLEGFMQGYWKSDSLKFIGKSGITYGWQPTLNNYKRSYPDTTAMGKLKFELIEVKRLSVMYFHVIGKWQLTITKGNQGGHFSLLLRKIKNKWVIITDHSS